MVQAIAASGSTEQSQYAVASVPQTHAWNALFDPFKDCLVLPGNLASAACSVESLAQQDDVSLRIMGQKQELRSAVNQQLPGPLAGYILNLLDHYEAFMDTSIMRIRLERVTSRACWKWHQDYTTLRLITTLRGAGTEYLQDQSQPDDISQCGTGEIGLFKGRLFGNHFGLEGHGACVHRSPPWDENCDPRLLLVIDTPQDFEIERA